MQRVADLQALGRLLGEPRRTRRRSTGDYGNRSSFETLFAEFFVVQDIRDTIKHLRRWMKPSKRHIDMMVYPGEEPPDPAVLAWSAIVPWNFPLNLSFAPLTSIFAAGNRAMVKMSENSAHLAPAGLAAPRYFPPEKLMFFEDAAGRGPAFSASLPFDHLLFTGSPDWLFW